MTKAKKATRLQTAKTHLKILKMQPHTYFEFQTGDVTWVYSLNLMITVMTC